MAQVVWGTTRRCPYCSSPEVERSRRTGVFERTGLCLLLLRPFRCRRCNDRHYGFVLSKHRPAAMIERRLHPRMAARFPLRLRPVGGDIWQGPEPLFTKNISASGVSFLIPFWIESGTAMDLEVDLLDQASATRTTLARSAHAVRIAATDAPRLYILAAVFDEIMPIATA